MFVAPYTIFGVVKLTPSDMICEQGGGGNSYREFGVWYEREITCIFENSELGPS